MNDDVASDREDDVTDLRDEVLAADDTGMIRQQQILTVTELNDVEPPLGAEGEER